MWGGTRISRRSAAAMGIDLQYTSNIFTRYACSIVLSGTNMARRKTQTIGETLADRAYRELKHDILHGAFPEGSFLAEAEVLRRYRIGRTPFREACNRLSNEQLLAAVARRGYYVPELS